MVQQLKAKLAIGAHDKVGEGPSWDGARSRLLWADHAGGLVHEAQSDGAGGWRETRQWNLNRHLAAAVPRAQGGIVAVGASEVFALNDAGELIPFAHIDGLAANERMNDAKCDSQGRLWITSLTADFRPGASGLYRVDPDGSARKVLDGFTLGNGLDWSPDGRIFYVVDSLTQRIDAFDFDGVRGEIANRRTLVTVERGAPNGICVDREGGIWAAVTGGAAVHRHSPGGELLVTVTIGTPGATSCAFGGEDGGELFITSRSGRMPDVARSVGLTSQMMDNEGPEAGALFVCRPGQTGAPATPFAG